ncbi:MAG: N-acetylmuramoyl-L-alanine amidase [Oscillospiraceae bacterium]|nr:N-acetylmuramoyl-L-alanine amidase [Oscillospiraceae bacterium]
MFRRYTVILLFLIVLVSVIGYALFKPEEASPVSAEEPELSSVFAPFAYTPVIDPGHGGIDPGAESAGGFLEKDMNLDIALKTELMIRFLGIKPVLTRESDVSIHDADMVSIRDKKASDIRNRVKLVNGVQNGVLLSIHQNYFDQSQYHGAQVFYNGSENKGFAEIMQEMLRTSLDPVNTRQSKATGSVYLLSHVQKPAVLIECGFLSNPGEEAKLRSDEYQLKMAMAITKGFLDWSATNK